ncbi:MAG: NOG1 family protein [Candidatus Jordarchaeum sp.]|uniref:NOG1 family protein n=1 Tax=Candidatus Jordarchaeum sp. TaxID=2823881 RepID=UPI00404988E9
MNPFSKIKKIYSSDELLDIVFHRGSQLPLDVPRRVPPSIKAKKREVTRVKFISDNLVKYLIIMVKKFPNLDEIHPFYRELADVLVGVDRLKEILASLEGSARIIKKIANKKIRDIKFSENPKFAAKARIEAYARISSIIKKLEKRLNFLIEASKKLSRLPSIDTNEFTIVVAGYPNTGKSSFVRAVSSAKPEIAEYPFTTRNIVLGHFSYNNVRCQIIDTPGILDRPMRERNRIELQAITAIRHVANVVVFIIDPSLSCGYPIERQLELLKEIKETFPSLPVINVINKVDLMSSEDLEEVKKKIDKPIEMIAIQDTGVQEAIDTAMKAGKLQGELKYAKEVAL